jgi:hypothetical protein
MIKEINYAFNDILGKTGIPDPPPFYSTNFTEILGIINDIATFL